MLLYFEISAFWLSLGCHNLLFNQSRGVFNKNYYGKSRPGLWTSGKRKGEILDLFQVPLSEIPIKKILGLEQKQFIEIVDKILAITKISDYLENSAKQAKVHDYEHQIDQMVYKLYNLTPEEIKIVENSSKN